MNECLKCKHRGTLVNSRHSKCTHPNIEMMLGDHDWLYDIIRAFASDEYLYELNIMGMRTVFSQPVGGNWTLFPFNFDPVWLESCTGYEPSKEYIDKPDARVYEQTKAINRGNGRIELVTERVEEEED